MDQPHSSTRHSSQARRAWRATVALVALGVAMAWAPSSAQAQAAAMVRGIDVQLVLGLHDVARQAHHKQVFAQSWDRHHYKRFRHLKTIVIDPGHGGDNQGALGVAKIHEKFLTLELAYALRARLQRDYPEARVVLTRYWDRSMGLSERVHLANAQGADVFLSLHYNSAPHERAVGVETYFLTPEQASPEAPKTEGQPLASASGAATGLAPEDTSQPRQGTYNDAMSTLVHDLKRMEQHANSGLLAQLVQRHLMQQLKGVDRGVKQANFGVLRGALMPAVVIEAGFVSHPKEGKLLVAPDHRARAVEGLIEALTAFDEALASKYARDAAPQTPSPSATPTAAP